MSSTALCKQCMSRWGQKEKIKVTAGLLIWKAEYMLVPLRDTRSAQAQARRAGNGMCQEDLTVLKVGVAGCLAYYPKCLQQIRMTVVNTGLFLF